MWISRVAYLASVIFNVQRSDFDDECQLHTVATNMTTTLLRKN